MANRVKVRIIGRDYNLLTDNTPAYTQMLAEKLNSYIKKMLDSSSSMSSVDAAVLAALDALDEAAKSAANADNIRSQMGEYLAEADAQRQKAEAAKKEIASLKRRISQLEAENASKNPEPKQNPAKPASKQTEVK